MKRWKLAEKRAAEAFGVERNVRLNWWEEGPDLKEHHLFSVEVKSRKKISAFIKAGLEQARKYYKDKMPLLAIFEAYRRDGIVVMELQDFKKLLSLNGLEKPQESASNLDGVLEITQDENGKFKISVKQQ